MTDKDRSQGPASRRGWVPRPSRAAGWLLWTAAGLASPFCHTVFDGVLGAYSCSEEGAIGPPGCPAEQTCVTGVCVAIGRPLGEPCGSDADCQPDAGCLSPTDFGQDDAPLCTRLCCASSDCGPPEAGLVCWPPPDGAGSLCWPASSLGRPLPGQSAAGDACSDDGECRSALCQQGRCLDTCCDDSYCPQDKDTCRVMASPLAEHDSWVCAPPPTNADADFCSSDDDCRSGACLSMEADVLLCAQPCCSSRECGTIYLGTSFEPLGCAPTEDGTLRACSKLLTEAATRELGAPCLEDGQCRSGLCYLASSDAPYCSDSCCTDESCGDTSAFACRPVEAGGTWALRCVRK